MADDGYRDAVAAGSVAVAGGWLALRGAAAKTRGDLTAAIADLETASHLFDGGSSGPLLAPCLAELAVARAVSGDLAGAEQTRQLADAAPGCRMFVPWLTLSRAWITAAGGDTTLAARQARTAADVAMASGQYAVEAMARYDVSRLGDPNAVRHRLAELADVVQGPLVPVMASAAAALARSDPGALDVATAKFTELGMDLFAAETATAAAALRQAAAPAGGVARPDAATPLLRLTARLAGLTRRERDVALLAAERVHQPRHRAPAGTVRPHRRQLPGPGLPEAGGDQPPGAGPTGGRRPSTPTRPRRREPPMTTMSDLDKISANQEGFNLRARAHLQSSYYDVEKFKQGHNMLRKLEREELGDVRGRSLLELQCHIGVNSLSLARLGAQVTGTDISDEAIDIANGLAA